MFTAELVKWLTRRIVAPLCKGSTPLFRPIVIKNELFSSFFNIVKTCIIWYNIGIYWGDKMLDNKLGITNEIELSKEEERITKQRALELFDTGKINEFEVGTFKGLSNIHEFLFSDIYTFAGEVRDVNIAKGNFRFAPVIYLDDVLKKIDSVPTLSKAGL